jgi:hypothetical protein
MKHAANRSKRVVKAKTKILTQNTAVTKTKPSEKSVGKVALTSRQKLSVEKAKSAAVKVMPKSSTSKAKTAIKKTVPKLSAKTLNALKTTSARKVTSIDKQIEKPRAKVTALKVSIKAVKTPIQKAKKISTREKAAAIEKTRKPTTIKTTQKAKPKPALLKPPAVVKSSAKTSVKTTKSQALKIPVKTAKLQQTNPVKVIATKVKTAAKKANSDVAATSLKNTVKTKPIVATKPVERKKIALAVTPKKVNGKSKKTQPVVLAKTIVKKADKIKPIVANKKIVKKIQKAKPVASAVAKRKQSPKIKNVVRVKKIKPVEHIIETPKPSLQKPKNRKAKPISSAVFRGKKERYDFKVFELNEKFEAIPAVYIISKRKTDRNKKGHHALVCIGETTSIADELKRHRKSNCVKKHAANVVSILHEADEKIRLKIETDLKAAHFIACNLK